MIYKLKVYNPIERNPVSYNLDINYDRYITNTSMVML